MEKKLDLILNKLGSIEDRLDRQDEVLKSHGKQLKSHGNLLHQLIKSFAATSVKVNEIEKKLEKNTMDIEEIKNSMVTQADLKYFDQKIAEHDREIMKIKLS